MAERGRWAPGKSRRGDGRGRQPGRWPFWVLAAVLGLLASLLVARPALLSRNAPAGAVRVRIDMSGFQPRTLRIRAGEPVTLTLVNPDNRFHADGGGYHNFVVEALGVRQVVAPMSTRTFRLVAPAPGRYEFYCDICCGGKENPAMRGVLVVE